MFDNQIVEFMTPERLQRILQVLNRRQNDMTVVADKIHKDRNLSAIIRSCDAVGVDTVHCVTPKSGYQTFRGTSASAEKWVDVQHHADVTTILRSLKHHGWQIVAANLCTSAVDYREINYTLPTALVLGAEVEGVSDEARLLVDKNIVIPMFGMVESFNVSVACAIVLREMSSQREAANMYDQRRLPEALYKKRFFHWAHPKLAQFCDDHALEYPAVGDDGEVINLSAWYEKVKSKN